MAKQDYEALTPDSLADRLSGLASVAKKLGGDSSSWSVREVGDGNLNLVFIVEGTTGTVIVKQALPYVRLVGESWPLPLYRAFYEYHALIRQAERAPGSVPEVFHFDETQALIVMEFLHPHTILRHKFIKGERVHDLGRYCGTFCAQTAFRGSELSMPSATKKQDVGLFSGSVEIPAITEALVFTAPYYEAEMNNHTSALDPIVAELRSNVRLKTIVQSMLAKFTSNTETMLHGDLHSGSIMATETEVKVIDPEFAQYGPMSFDVGMLIANFMMAYFSQPAHRKQEDSEYQDWILAVIVKTVEAFEAEFKTLWKTERTGILYPKCLFEDQGHNSLQACDMLLKEIWHDALRFCGIEMHRRCLSLAHNADFEEIKDETLRAKLEARNLLMASHLIENSDTLSNVNALQALARDFNTRTFL